MRIPLKDTLIRASTRKRLWIGAGMVAVFIGTLLTATVMAPSNPRDMGKVGLDFIAFYTAGNFVGQGRSADLYDIGKVHAFQVEVGQKNGVDLGPAVGPWWNPPFYAWVFVPIAKYSYREALKYWEWINLACAAIAAAVLCFWVARASCSPSESSKATSDMGKMPMPLLLLRAWRSWLLVPVLIILSTPFIHALSHAQNTCTSLLLVTIAVMFWRMRWAVAAGLVMGLLFYKPQLGAVMASVLVLSLGRRALIGLSITGATLLLASLVLRGSLYDFVYQMPKNLHFVQCEVPYMWDRHVTFKAFWRLLLQGFKVGEVRPLVTVLSGICSACIGAGLLWVLVRSKKAGAAVAMKPSGPDVESTARLDRLIAATISSTPLLMPFYFDYDQLLLAVPAVLFVTDLLRRGQREPLSFADRWLIRIWPVQYVWMIFNPDISVVTHFNLGVLLLTSVAVLLIARAGLSCKSVQVAEEETPASRPVLRAA